MLPAVALSTILRSAAAACTYMQAPVGMLALLHVWLRRKCCCTHVVSKFKLQCCITPDRVCEETPVVMANGLVRRLVMLVSELRVNWKVRAIKAQLLHSQKRPEGNSQPFWCSSRSQC